MADSGGDLRRRPRRHHLFDLLWAPQPHQRGSSIGLHLRPRFSRALVNPFYPIAFFSLIDADTVTVALHPFWFGYVCLVGVLCAVCGNGWSTLRKGRSTLAPFASRVAGPATLAGSIFSQWEMRTIVWSLRRALNWRKMLGFLRREVNVSGLNSQVEGQTKELEGLNEKVFLFYFIF